MLSQTGESAPGYYASMRVIPSASEGQRLFQQKGCIGCHSIGGQGGKIGPALDDVGLRRQPEWMIQHFRDPQTVSSGTVMPRFGFTETEARALTDFLVHLRDQKVALSLPSLMGPVERGREVFRKYGCAGCHGADAKGGVPNPNAKTAEQVPGLIYVADGYTKDELKTAHPQWPARNHGAGPEASAAAALHGRLGRHHQGCRAGRPGRLSLQLETQGRKSGFLAAGGRF